MATEHREFVQVLVPGLIHREPRVFPARMKLIPLPDFPWQGSADDDRIRDQSRARRMIFCARVPLRHRSMLHDRRNS